MNPPGLRGLGRLGSAYAASIIVAGIALVPVGWILHPLRPDQLAPFLLLAVFTQVSALMPIRWGRGVLTVDNLPLSAAGLLLPGGGVVAIALLFTFDGRRPGPDFPVWRLMASRAKAAVEHGVTSLAVAAIPVSGAVATPVRTVAYAALSVAVAYPLVAGMFAFIEGGSFTSLMRIGLRQSGLHSVVLLVLGGGILSLLLQTPSGYLMSIGLLGFLFAIRSNIADAQRQREAKLQTLKLAAQVLDARDRYTESHSQRVSELSLRLGQALRLSAGDLDRLGVGGILHDIGKIGIPDAILNKRGPLTEAEWVIMRRHPDLGADMILGHSALADVAPMVRHHHERWDGTGYPGRLQGPDIPPGGRILAVADSYDTITRVRIYRRSLMTSRQAVSDISRLAGRWYDPAVVNALRALHGVPPLPETQPAPSGRGWAGSGARLLAQRTRYRRLALASGISSLGDPLTTVATLVTVYALSKSPVLVACTYITKAVATLVLGGLLSGLSDRFDRRRLIFRVEVLRAGVLVAAPFLVAHALLLLFPVVFVLAGAEAVVGPAREAALPEIVPAGDVRVANSTLGAVNTAAQVVGYPLAGFVLAAGLSTTVLFWLDAATFLTAALIGLGLGFLGGSVGARGLGGGLAAALAVREARPLLLIAGLGAFFVAMTMPSLIALAYQLSARGAQAFTLLELAISVGVVTGNLLIWRLGRVSSGWLMAAGLAVMGLLSLAVAASPVLGLSAALLLIASIGNAWYVVANRTALQESGQPHNLGSLMATRFSFANLMVIAGAALGGWLTGSIGPRYVYGVIGVGLAGLALLVALTSVSSRQSDGESAGLAHTEAREPGVDWRAVLGLRGR